MPKARALYAPKPRRRTIGPVRKGRTPGSRAEQFESSRPAPLDHRIWTEWVTRKATIPIGPAVIDSASVTGQDA
jgi:hypothetical protein